MSTTRTHTKTIDGTIYTTTTLPATDGLRIMPKLVALLGDSLVGLIFATDEKQRDGLMEDPKILAAIVTGIATTAAETDGLMVIKDLLRTTEADRVRIGDAEVPGSVHTHFDLHFAGRYKHLIEVAMWVGQVNFFAP
jgi:hypothetical protein